MTPSTFYLNLPQSLIENRDDFYKSGIKEVSKIRNLITTCQRVFVVPSGEINLYLLGEKDVYCIEVSSKKSLICKLYYLPKDFRLDLYDGGNPWEPLFMWKSKKCVYRNIPETLRVLNIETLFNPLLAVS